MDIDKARKIFEEPEPDIAEQWLRYLSDEQMAVEEAILTNIITDTDFQFHIILGGAGTGKTQVLLLLADELQEAGFHVGYFTSLGVRTMIEKAGLDMPPASSRAGAVRLVDDPMEVGEIIEAIRNARNSKARALVVAIDPFQWTERTAFLKLATILGDHDPSKDLLGNRNTLFKIAEELGSLRSKKHFLRTAYRQNEEVGAGSVQLSKAIFKSMNPYVDDAKKNQFSSITSPYIETIMNNLNHSSPGGKFQVFELAEERDLWAILPELFARADRWNWTDSILFVSDNNQGNIRLGDLNFESPTLAEIEDSTFLDVLKTLGARIVQYTNPTLVRGQEFQDVIICVSKFKWRQFKLQKEGMNGPEWKSVMPIYTFVTRAIDTVSIFVI